MNKKLGEVGKSLEETLIKKVEENNIEIDKKLNLVMSQTKTYAELAKNTKVTGDTQSAHPEIPDSSTTVNVPANLRSIMRDAKNDQLTEENERKQRCRNLILHGVSEYIGADKDEAKKSDEEYIKNFIGAVRVAAQIKLVMRIGKVDQLKKRPIKVVLNNEEDKDKIMDSLRNLKDNDDYKGISVTEDYTVAERELIREFNEKAKDRNFQEAVDSKYVWRVRGSPKNGLLIKKFPKRIIVIRL